MEKQIKLFLEFLENDKKLSSNTLQSYKRDIIQFQEYLDNERLNYSKLGQQEIKEYIEYLKKIGKKTSTISRNLASIRSFYQFELRSKKVKKDPTEGMQSPKIEKKAPSILSSAEVELLLEQPSDVDLKGIRDKAMLEFAYATGMRVTEIISLNIGDVNFENAYVVCSTGSKKRNIPLGNLSLKALEEYVKKISGSLSHEPDVINTNNVIVNAILNTKYQEAGENGIVFVLRINDLSGLRLEDEDIVTILSNLLDNAIEACKKCDISRRILKLKFVIEDGMVKIGVRNTFDSPVLYENGEIKSTRLVSAEEHGVGIKNIIEVIEKYDGSYVIKDDGQEFFFSIMIPE